MVFHEGTRWELDRQAKKSSCATKNYERRIPGSSWRFRRPEISHLHVRYSKNINDEPFDFPSISLGYLICLLFRSDTLHTMHGCNRHWQANSIDYSRQSTERKSFSRFRHVFKRLQVAVTKVFCDLLQIVAFKDLFRELLCRFIQA